MPTETKTAADTIGEALAAFGPLGADEIAKLTELKPATVERALRKMAKAGTVAPTTGSDGRRWSLVSARVAPDDTGDGGPADAERGKHEVDEEGVWVAAPDVEEDGLRSLNAVEPAPDAPTTGRNVLPVIRERLDALDKEPVTRVRKPRDGGIAQKVVAFLGRFPDEPFTPYKITQGIDGGHSTGAVWAACASMVKRGELVKVSDSPVRYTLPS